MLVHAHARSQPRGAGQKVTTAGAAVVNGAAYSIPYGWHQLPLIDQDRRPDLRDRVQVGGQRLPLFGPGQQQDRGRALIRRGGLANALGALQGDGREVGNNWSRMSSTTRHRLDHEQTSSIWILLHCAIGRASTAQSDASFPFNSLPHEPSSSRGGERAEQPKWCDGDSVRAAVGVPPPVVGTDPRAFARVGHLRTKETDHEIDLIVEGDDRRAVAIEVRLSQTVSDRDVRHLNWLHAQLGTEEVSDRVILTTGGHAYRRPDGVAVVPLALLGP